MLDMRYQFDFPMSDMKVAINDEFVDWQYSLQEDDKVVFISPVAGG